MPLNFTKSINLALSVRGITAMQNAEPNTPEGERKLLDHVLAATIPMRGRMIHGRKASGELYEEAQDYDVHGRVSTTQRDSSRDRVFGADSTRRLFSLWIVAG